MVGAGLLLIAMLGQPPAAPGAGAASSPPLRGPALAERVKAPSLVSYDMQGRLRDLEGTPEHVALKMLELSPAEREGAERVIVARAARVDAFVTQNLLMFGQLDSAGKAGAKLDTALL